jgi:cell division protein ZapA
MKQVEVQIMGQSYLLASPEGGEQRLLEAVEKVDSAMCKIRDAGKVRARDRIAVLAALNVAFDLMGTPALASSASAIPAIAPFAPGVVPGLASEADGGSAVLANLLGKLDSALGSDGQLI